MKRIVAIVIALLTLCLMLTPTAFAEGSTTDVTPPAIAAASMRFEKQVDMYFYVYFGETEPTTTDYGVIFWTEEQTEYTYEKATAEGAKAKIVMGTDETVTDVEYKTHPCKMFTYGVSATCMTDMIYVQGFMKNDSGYAVSKVIPYSVQTYAGNKLGIYPNGVEGNAFDDSEQGQKFANMVKSLLIFGSTSQIAYDYRTDDLADSILHWSKGLAYTPNADGKTCYVSGIGTCTDTDLYIPKVALVDGDCAGLTVTGVGDNAFMEENGFTSVTIPNTVTSIGNSAFIFCNGLKKITIPGSVTSLEAKAFNGCERIEEIVIPDGITEIHFWTFRSCNKLKSVTIPNSVATISYNAFEYCSALETITFNGTMAEWESITKGSDWNANTPAYTIYCTDGEIAK